jgi:hypothetical protein
MRKSSTGLTYVLAVLFALVIPASAPAQVQEISQTVKKLKAVPVDTEMPSTEVPDEASLLLTQLKHELRDLVAARLAEAGRDAMPAGIQRSVLNDLKAGGIELRADLPDGTRSGPVPEDAEFGFIQKITIEKSPTHEDLLVAVVTLQIPCGSDSSFYIFQWQKTAWNLILAQEANGYSQVDGAQGNFGYSISAPDVNGRWFVATVDVNLWCTSNWQAIRYKILRVGSNAYEPKVLYTGKSGIFLEDELYKLKTTSDTVSLSFVAEQSLDMGILLRVHLLNFGVTGDAVTRIEPLALRPEEFLDEWFQLAWSDASKSVEKSQESHARLWHEWKKPVAPADSSLRFVQPCGHEKPAKQWVVGIDWGEGATVAKSLYFKISRTDGTFRILGVSEIRPAGCPGESPPDYQPHLTLP